MTNESELQLDGYPSLFRQATGEEPFPFQSAFARDLPSLVNVPTGLGKTAMAVLGWLWRRQCAGEDIRAATPCRLVYCLPMRVLVEQTRNNAKEWIKRLREKGLMTNDVPVHILMGGEDAGDWELHPERDMILIGTQDMLLSRALNRGYAASRARWPMQFGLLHTDCLWVFDEIQLMGSGLATTAQLEAFRRFLPNTQSGEAKIAHRSRSVWMSATLRAEWLRTVDFKDRIDHEGRIDGKATLSLSKSDHANMHVRDRWSAKKPLSMAGSEIDKPAALAAEVLKAHRPGTRTIVVVNTVKRACELFDAVSSAASGAAPNAKGGRRKKGVAASAAAAPEAPAPGPNLVLLHSRFRPPDRAKRVAEALATIDPNDLGTIIISTQVIEAGVDVSAATLFTELAPWASLVQRFGRCNRRGEQNDQASVRWIDLPVRDTDAKKARLPYELADLRAAADELKNLQDVGPGSLCAHRQGLSEETQRSLFPHRHTHVIRRKDLIDLFDTTPDLAGNDIDIDRYVREVEETDVRVFWREWDRPKGFEPPPDDKAWRRPGRDELCPVPVGSDNNPGFRQFAKKHKGRAWRWDFTEGRWQRVENENAIYPGQIYLVHTSSGGYDSNRGWIGADGKAEVAPFDPAVQERPSDDATEEEIPGKWQTIAQHTEDVCHQVDAIIRGIALTDPERQALTVAARWHDWGKSHPAFQEKVKPDAVAVSPLAEQARRFIGKAPKDAWRTVAELKALARERDSRVRRHFRHELASALAALQRPHESLKALCDDDLDLVAYLIAAHHGKVRVSIRSMPNELRPPSDNGRLGRFARGVWHGDELPSVNLGGGDGGVVTPAVTLSLEPMEIGLCEEEPFAGQPSWLERTLRLRDTLGPFRLAYLEALLRAADWRASAGAVEHEQPRPAEEVARA